jgi:hypothetical protein
VFGDSAEGHEINRKAWPREILDFWIFREALISGAENRAIGQSDAQIASGREIQKTAGIEVDLPTERRHDNAPKPTPPLRYN